MISRSSSDSRQPAQRVAGRTVKEHALAADLLGLLGAERCQDERVLARCARQEDGIGRSELLERILQVDGRLPAVFPVRLLGHSRERHESRQHVKQDICPRSSTAAVSLRGLSLNRWTPARRDAPSFFSHPQPR
jgi:hypothetical protein